jgi:NADP-dependent 3-hydroxy acid dehydrogenase YdfG
MNNHKKLAVITGATSGIGLELAKILSAQGNPLLLIGRRQQRLDEINLSNCLKKAVDVTDYEGLSLAIKEAESIYGDVDLMVNNAGLMQLGDVETQSIKQWEDMLNTNVKGVMYGSKIVLPNMKKNKHGTIINISSVAGKKVTPERSGYCASKFAVSAFTEGLRIEACHHNVRVVAVCPGVVDTELQSHTTEEKYKDSVMKIGKDEKLALSAKEIAETIAYIYNLPQKICVRDIIITATAQER